MHGDKNEKNAAGVQSLQPARPQPRTPRGEHRLGSLWFRTKGLLTVPARSQAAHPEGWRVGVDRDKDSPDSEKHLRAGRKEAVGPSA